MKGFACAYRHFLQTPANRRRTEQEAGGDELTQRFLDRYDQPDCYYDWGDDPSFFASQELLGDTRLASWGVCRTNVRSWLSVGDIIVFFCASQFAEGWEYFYVGVGTIHEALSREQVWHDDAYEPYRRFYNILARPGPDGWQQHETFHEFHEDWRRRIEAPYFLFDPDRTHFNVTNPLLVGTFLKEIGAPERWRSDADPLVERLERVLFEERGIARRLRTSNTYRPHTQVNLAAAPPARSIVQLREELLDISGHVVARAEPSMRRLSQPRITTQRPRADGQRRPPHIAEQPCARCYQLKPLNQFDTGSAVCRDCG